MKNALHDTWTSQFDVTAPKTGLQKKQFVLFLHHIICTLHQQF